jgi:transglutaminase-like putative cysteine protease
MRLKVTHTTRYRYAEPLRYTVQTLCLTPQSSPAQTVEYWSLGTPGTLFAHRDGLGNSCHSYSFLGQTMTSFVNAAGVVDTHGVAECVDAPGLPHPLYFLRPSSLATPDSALAEFAGLHLAGGRDTPSLLRLAQAVSGHVAYTKDSTDVTTTALQAFARGAGVCQDQAHVMVAACRSAGIPARYVSGYFYAANEPDLASHAWAEVCLDVQRGHWISIDVTHVCPVDQRHVRLAIGTDYNDCPPIKGVRQGGGQETMTVNIGIEPV